MENQLRKEAESLLKGRFSGQNVDGKSIEEIIHELKVHQIELELQNEELLETQQELIASRKKYFELFELAPIAYLMVNENTIILDTNLTAATLLQSDKERLKGKKFNTFIHPNYQDGFYLFFKNIASHSREAIHESCLLLGKEEIFIRISSNKEKNSEKNPSPAIRFTLIDITEKKNAEMQHLESERRFRQFAALLPQVVCELDGDFNILYVNDFGKKLFGLDEDQERNLMSFLDERNQKVLLESFHALISQPLAHDSGAQITFQAASGQEVTLFTYANYDIENGKITTIRAIGIDLSERIKLEHQLNALNEELSMQKAELENFNRILEQRIIEEVEKNRAKDHIMSLKSRQAALGEMIGQIAHQWKQPLNTLNLIVTDIQDAFQYNELTDAYLDKSVVSAREVIQHMAQTIDDFRNFFKPLKSKTVFNIREQTTKALSFIRASIEIEDISIKEEIADNLHTRGYPNEYLQVIINIVNNAREAILENRPKEALISIRSMATENTASIFIENNGGSIPDSILSQIFEPYFTTKEKANGTGIGLYMAKSIIVRNMEGDLQVNNTDHGVVFEIILPLT